MNDSVDSTPILFSKLAQYGGALGAFVSGWTISEIGVVIGSVVAILGFVFAQYWAWRRERREVAEQEMKMVLEYGPKWRELLSNASATGYMPTPRNRK